MFSAAVTLIAIFPVFASFLLVSCLKSWKFKGDETKNRESEVYVKKVDGKNEKPKNAKPAKEVKKAKIKNPKNPDGKEKKSKNLAKFFIFHKDDLKTSKTSDLSLDSTQKTWNSEDENEHESPLSSYHFTEKENLGNIKLLPDQPDNFAEKLKTKVRRGRRGRKSPQDYFYPEEEDSLFNVPSLAQDQATLMSSRTYGLLDIQDSRILNHQKNHLDYKKSHCTYSNSSVSTLKSSADSLSHASDASSDVTIKN